MIKFLFKNYTHNIYFLVSVFLMITNVVYADTVFLKDGSIIEGKIISETTAKVAINNGDTHNINKNDIIRTLYHNDYKKKQYITKMNGEIIEVYIVDEDRESYIYRKILNSNDETKILKDDINSISKKIISPQKDNDAKSKNSDNKNKKTAFSNGNNNKKSTWYIGFGLGTGNGSWKINGEYVNYEEWSKEYSGGSTMSLNFGAGLILTPNLLIGAEITAIERNTKYEYNGETIDAQISNYIINAIYFPQETGFFIKGGTGLGIIEIEDEFANELTATGFSGLLGTGYYFKLGETFNIGLNFDISYQNYFQKTGMPSESMAFSLYASLYWF